MPHLRFTRDRRGYENTFLVDTVRRRGREHGRVLYWFRSPPQVKVGRAAIDEDAIRAIEDAYPDVTFDWSRILEARPPEPEPPVEERRRVRRSGRERDARRDPPPAPPARVIVPMAADVEPLEPAGLLSASDDQELETSRASHDADEGEDAADLVPDVEERADAAVGSISEPAHATEPSAAAQVLGSEGLLRLRARYAEVGARIASQVSDPARQETLRTLAERLNPDAWVTEPDVAAGLEQFEQVLDQIRREVGPLRRRTRRGGRRNRRRREGSAAPGTPQPHEAANIEGEPDASTDPFADGSSQTDSDEPDDSGPGE